MADLDRTEKISLKRLQQQGTPRTDAGRAETERPDTAPTSYAPPSAASRSTPAPDDEVYAIEKPAWPLGLAMQPHHLEAQDAYHERRTTLTVKLVVDQSWGIDKLDLDHEALPAGEVAIRRFVGIFPDGTLLSLSGVAGESALQRSYETALREAAQRDRKTVDVFLGVPREMPGKPLVDAADGSTEPRRYARRISTRPELETGENPAPVPWLRPNVRILFEGEPTEAYSVLRIAQLFLGPNGRVVYTRKIVPAVLRVGASSVLRDLLQDVHQRLVETCAALAGQRRGGNEMTVSDAARAVLLGELGGVIPRMARLLDADVSPGAAYQTLAALAGRLAAYGKAGAATVPRFDLLQLGSVFGDLSKQMLDVLAVLTAARFREIPLARRPDGLRLAELHEPGLMGKDFVLTVRGGDPARLRVEVPLVAKLAAMELLGPILNAAAKGIPLVAETRPAGLDVPPQTVCFRVERRSEQWEELVRRGTLAIYLPEEHRGLDVGLFVKEPGVLE